MSDPNPPSDFEGPSQFIADMRKFLEAVQAAESDSERQRIERQWAAYIQAHASGHGVYGEEVFDGKAAAMPSGDE